MDHASPKRHLGALNVILLIASIVFLSIPLSAQELPESVTREPADVSEAQQRLWDAARDGDLGGIEAALADGAAIDGAYRDGASALIYAAQRGRTDAVRLLLERGADPDARSIMNQTTALHLAIPDAEAVEALVAAGADPNRRDLVLDCTPLGCAVLRRCRDCLRAMLTSDRLEAPTLWEARQLARRAGAQADSEMLRRALAKRGFEPSWPQFRGPGGLGHAEGGGAPTRWNLETGENVLWSTPIAGLAHSSPVVWGDQVFVTTAVSSA
ncbi:MAG: ankyrin repeat domain-containing protein, partial [Acidobacteriota bacterium]